MKIIKIIKWFLGKTGINIKGIRFGLFTNFNTNYQTWNLGFDAYQNCLVCPISKLILMCPMIVTYRCKTCYYNNSWTKHAWLCLSWEIRQLPLFVKPSFVKFHHFLTRWRVCVCPIYSKRQGFLELSRKCLNFRKRWNVQLKIETDEG